VVKPLTELTKNDKPFIWTQSQQKAFESIKDTRRRYVVKQNLITEVYLMTVMETTTCFGLC